MARYGFVMFEWSWIEASVLGSQVFGQASMDGCDRQTGSQADKDTGRQADLHTGPHTHRHTCTQTRAHMLTGRQAHRNTGTQPSIQACPNT